MSPKETCVLDASPPVARGARGAVDTPAPVPASPSERERRSPRGGGRADIQGLRAIAVALVVAYHLRPDLLPGGFIGVDVFLVISGFLIVGSLGREATASGTVSLRSFYARRIRRLLPASTVVLLATTAATLLLMPQSRWLTTAKGVVASALDVQNWALAAGAGYGAATAAVSPLQHYWSLAVEEQFYLVTPLLLLLVVRVAGRGRRSRALAVAGLVAVVTAASFVHSVEFSRTHHDIAYYATTTRMWELGVGGLLALLAPRLHLPRFGRGMAVWTGLAAIGVCAVEVSTAVAFPGWIAAVPVVGSALVILGGTTAADRTVQPAAAVRLLGIRPLAVVGDLSYSLYLWHWPVIVFYVFRTGRAPGPVACAVLCAACLALAALSTRFLERPFRRAPGHRDASAARGAHAAPRGGRAFRLAAALVALSLVAGVAPWAWMDHRQAALAAVRPDDLHSGGTAVLPDRLPRPAAHVIPDPAVAAQDGPLVYQHEGCGTYDPRKDDPRGCVFGDPQGAVTVALVGDSHAAQYSSVLAEIAGARHVALHTMVRNGCPFTGTPMLMKGVPNSDCADANQLTRDALLRLHPRVVIVSAMQPTGYRSALGWTWSSEEELVAGYRELWSSLTGAGIRVLVIRDNPTPDYVDPECVERYGSASARCGMSRTDGVTHQPDPEVRAAQGLPGVTVLDLTDHLCNHSVCPGVIGNVLVYRDNHMTNTFTLTLRPVLSKALTALL